MGKDINEYNKKVVAFLIINGYLPKNHKFTGWGAAEQDAWNVFVFKTNGLRGISSHTDTARFPSWLILEIESINFQPDKFEDKQSESNNDDLRRQLAEAEKAKAEEERRREIERAKEEQARLAAEELAKLKAEEEAKAAAQAAALAQASEAANGVGNSTVNSESAANSDSNGSSGSID